MTSTASTSVKKIQIKTKTLDDSEKTFEFNDNVVRIDVRRKKIGFFFWKQMKIH